MTNIGVVINLPEGSELDNREIEELVQDAIRFTKWRSATFNIDYDVNHVPHISEPQIIIKFDTGYCQPLQKQADDTWEEGRHYYE